MRFCRTALLLSFALPGLRLAAQTAAPVPLEEMIVRATRLTDSPATVSTVELTAQPAASRTTGAVAARAANFFVAENGAESFNDVFALRGLTNTPLFGDPAVGVYLDDLPLGSAFTFPVALGGFARAELHRGPTQNTLYGRAGSAGVLVLSTPAAGAQPAGELSLSAGNFSARRLAASAASASREADAYVYATAFTRDGYVTNTSLGRDIDAQDSRSALLRLHTRADGTDFTLLATAHRARHGVQPLVPLGGPLFSVARASEGRTDVDAWNLALSAARAFTAGRAQLTLATGDWQLGPYVSTLAFGPMELVNDAAQRQRATSAEFKFAAPEQAAVRWQLGAFAAERDTTGAFTRQFSGFTFESSSFRIDGRELAAFGETTWTSIPALSFTAGLRIESSRKTLHRTETVPVVGRFDARAESSAWLPKLGVSYALVRDTELFATLGAGYKPGGFSAFTGNRALAAFGPERTRTFETGLTHHWPARRASVTLRAFAYDITGYQIERSFATSSVADDYLVVNAPQARSLGGEVEARWQPSPRLALAADLGATDVTLREFTDPYTGANYRGKRAPAVPAFDASLRADWTLTRGLVAGAEWSAVGRTYFTEGEDLAFAQRARATLRAHVTWEQGRFRLTLFGDNLTDAHFYSAITPGTGHGTPGAPRTYGLEFAARL